MRVTVCQIANEPGPLLADWAQLATHVHEQRTDLLVLPEMPFSPWLAAHRTVDREAWRRAVTVHRRWCDRLYDLGVPVVIGSRPVDNPGPRNRGFVWTLSTGLRDLHDKAYLPDEAGFWEATWYERGAAAFAPARVRYGAGDVELGLLLCTEMWFFEHARHYGRQGVQLLAVPRATPAATLDKWIAGGRAAAVVAGAYCLSSAPYNVPGSGADLGGGSWIIDPEGEVLVMTTPERPFATCAIDLRCADQAKSGYPRYVPEAE